MAMPGTGRYGTGTARARAVRSSHCRRSACWAVHAALHGTVVLDSGHHDPHSGDCVPCEPTVSLDCAPGSASSLLVIRGPAAGRADSYLGDLAGGHLAGCGSHQDSRFDRERQRQNTLICTVAGPPGLDRVGAPIGGTARTATAGP